MSKTATAGPGAGQFKHRIIRASAGTGKTFQLSNRFIGLLADDRESADSILSTTFTRKAAGEILDRVLLRLARGALDDGEAADLASHVGDAGLTRERCLDVLSRAARQLHRLRIGTLDSFFAQVARGFGLELGLPPGWRIADESEDAGLRREAVAAVIRQQETRDLKTLMNHLTKGETTRGVAELVHTTVKDLYGLYQETSREAWHSLPRYSSLPADELQATLAELRDTPLPGNRMLTARDKDLEAAVAGDWSTFISKGLAAKVRDGSYTFFKAAIPAAAVSLYEKLLRQATAELVGKLVLQTEGTYDLLEKFHVEYERLKRERRALRFDDITRRLADVELMGDVSRLAFRLDAHVEHLLLDEFQDTSPSQWRVMRPFAQRITQEAKRRSFFCVGDVKQAIYGWRGGVAEIFDAVAREVPGLESLPLVKSFRSAQPIIDTVNQVFTRLDAHPQLEREIKGVKLWSERFTPHTTDKTSLPGYVCLETAAEAEEGESGKESRLRYAAQRIAQIVNEAPDRQVGVLLRSNEGVARLVFELRSLGVHASEEGGNPLTDSAAVQVILSLLRLADHPGDKVAAFHVAKSPLAEMLGRRLGSAASHPISASATSPPATSPPARLDPVRTSQDARRDLVDHGYGPTTQRWAEALVSSCDRRELARLGQLVELAFGYNARATLRTADFLEFVQNQRVPDPTAANVRVMTIHQAKGLEFEIVVLPQLEGKLIGQPDSFVVDRPDPTGPVERVCRYANREIRDLLPESVQAMFDAADDREVTESLCVLYVALTRAEQALYMLVPPSTKSEKTFPKTYAGLLRAALHKIEPVPEKTKLYEHGDPNWHRRPETVADTSQPGAVGNALSGVPESPSAPLVVRLAPNAATRTRGLARTTPSGLEGGTKIPLSSVFATRENQFALDRGTLIHAFFEQIRWLDDGPPSDEVLRQAADRALDAGTAAAVGTSAAIADFRAMLARPDIAKAISRAAYASPRDLGFPVEVEEELKGAAPRLVVHNERTFALRFEESKLLQGSIDRLVLLYAGDQPIAADILDFKTDTVPPGDPAALREKVDHYRPQLDAYRKAISQMYHLAANRVTARLLFVGSGVVVPV